MTHPKTIEVFNKIAQKVKGTEPSTSGQATTYVVSEKQFNWLVSVYNSETKGSYLQSTATVTDDQKNQYSFGYTKCMSNVPKYIPNRAQYGKNYFITKVVVSK